MKILFLGYDDIDKNLAEWLRLRGEDAVYTKNKIDIDYVKTIKPNFIVSYNYQYILPGEILDFVSGRAINLHISYLPWNRGAYPNIWSFLENTPKGVSIIYIDKGIDTGNIIAQKEIFFDEDNETLKSSYVKLHKEIQELFKKNWDRIRKQKIKGQKQKCEGNTHYAREYETIVKPLIREKEWDIPINSLKEKYRVWKDSGVLKK